MTPASPNGAAPGQKARPPRAVPAFCPPNTKSVFNSEKNPEACFSGCLPKNKKPADFSRNQRVSWKGRLKSIFSRFKKLQEIHPTVLLATALLRRTSVLPKAKPWRRRNSFPPSILISHGIQKEKDILSDVLFFLEGTVKIDIFQRQPIPPRSGGTPTASPTKWVAVGKEEQGSGRMTSFLPQA